MLCFVWFLCQSVNFNTRAFTQTANALTADTFTLPHVLTIPPHHHGFPFKTQFIVVKCVHTLARLMVCGERGGEPTVCSWIRVCAVLLILETVKVSGTSETIDISNSKLCLFIPLLTSVLIYTKLNYTKRAEHFTNILKGLSFFLISWRRDRE